MEILKLDVSLTKRNIGFTFRAGHLSFSVYYQHICELYAFRVSACYKLFKEFCFFEVANNGHLVVMNKRIK